jgi:hypothetical protein
MIPSVARVRMPVGYRGVLIRYDPKVSIGRLRSSTSSQSRSTTDDAVEANDVIVVVVVFSIEEYNPRQRSLHVSMLLSSTTFCAVIGGGQYASHYRTIIAPSLLLDGIFVVRHCDGRVDDKAPPRGGMIGWRVGG